MSGFDSSLGAGQQGDSFCNAVKRPTNIDFNSRQGATENGKPFKPCASWCRPASYTGPQICGRVLTITGLTETYDELHLRQFGTIQEVWVQLMYAYAESFNEGRLIGNAPTTGVESPFPNVFFSAPEVLGIEATCGNGLKCSGKIL